LSWFSSVPPHNFEQEWNGDRQGKPEDTWLKSLCQSHSFFHESLKKWPRNKPVAPGSECDV
jgi:hypothetical protein